VTIIVSPNTFQANDPIRILVYKNATF